MSTPDTNTNADDASADGETTDDWTYVFGDPGSLAGGEPDLRPGSDNCYKCSSCDVSCPVAEVDDEFPGPKFQGPEQWRLKRQGDHDIDPSVSKCSNCMRCDDACPSGVPLSQMHNTARAEYVERHVSKRSLKYWRNRVLSNYGILARLGSKVPRLTNLVMGSRVTRYLNDRLFGVTAEREFPEFADETFREWWDDRGGDAGSRRRARRARTRRDLPEDADRKVAYFHGDYSNFNTPHVAKAMVRVFESYGYEVAVPDQRCSGTPMFANGMLDDARRAARFNVETFHALVERGYDVVCSCTSCSMALRQEYPELFDFEGTEEVAAHTYEALEFLRIHEDLRGDVAAADVEFPDLAYHAPCHARNQGLERQAVELFDDLRGVDVEDVGDSCSGISGTYGWKTENYDTSMAIGEEMFEHMEAAEGETGMTECPTCAMQMNHGTGYEICHPLEVLEAALVE
ncbi:anaerobic glycerol-3-phosphate dehydrogenase subunit C [Halomarina litorea]|uniref:anaerobic glycerol-3-phosphate dehydrogenase subunit C n=1 Tax=Halomarina litorea TaxID=2961595 RepID=UPI0020C3EE8D|nr:anaerobic glycerol-3-phosphate dehydrogenase subunit C [Halomarina sp. BCD28]